MTFRQSVQGHPCRVKTFNNRIYCVRFVTRYRFRLTSFSSPLAVSHSLSSHLLSFHSRIVDTVSSENYFALSVCRSFLLISLSHMFSHVLEPFLFSNGVSVSRDHDRGRDQSFFLSRHTTLKPYSKRLTKGKSESSSFLLLLLTCTICTC